MIDLEKDRVITLLKEIWVTLLELPDVDDDLEELQGRITDEIGLLKFPLLDIE